jgi:decaprenylphospho-beta-D-erythro-pentofuranosid-2-ulose 2-reductase
MTEQRAPRGVVVLGGTSEIANAIARELAREQSSEVVLVGRDEEALERAASRLREVPGTRAHTLAGLDANAPATHHEIVTRAFELLDGVDIVIVAIGKLGERGALPEDIAAGLDVLAVNVLGAGSLVLESAQALRARAAGTLVVLSSLAAERPRRSNAIYSASKAALDGLSEALADELRGAGVRVVVVRPGFVHTRMTRGLPVPPFASTTDAVAQATVAGLRRGRQTVWAPAAMRWVGLAMRLLPRPLFRRLSL